MLIRAPILLIIALAAGSCGQQSSFAGTRDPAPGVAASPTAGIGAEGYATITDAPPAPFMPMEPGEPEPPTAQQLAGHAQFARAGRFQNEVMDEVQALADQLRTAEKGNFVDLYFDNQGDPRVVFRFLRDPQRTLARYSRHPRFFAEQARFSEEELRAAMNYMLETFREDRVIRGGGTGNRRNRAVVEIAVTEPEFRALVARKGVTIPEAVELEFAVSQPARAVNRPLAPRIARLVRIFPRDDRPAGPLHSINSYAKVVLSDGCFRIAGGPQDGALVVFPLGAQLFIDREGHLAFGDQEAPGYARVGEELVTLGSIGEVTASSIVAAIHEACGGGKVVKINGMRSAAAERAQNAVTQNASALRQFRESYGLPESTARQALERCKARSGSGVCMLTPPPPPPHGGPDCPRGTKPSFGLCRTPEGYIRPIPEWIQNLIAG